MGIESIVLKVLSKLQVLNLRCLSPKISRLPIPIVYEQVLKKSSFHLESATIDSRRRWVHGKKVHLRYGWGR